MNHVNKIKHLEAVACLLLPCLVSSQLTVRETGKIDVGNAPQYANVPDFAADTVTAMKIYGNGFNGSEGRISFCDSHLK